VANQESAVASLKNPPGCKILRATETQRSVAYDRDAQGRPNKALQPTGLSVKHSAREKSRMLATEARG
jgi:hypothetical protein